MVSDERTGRGDRAQLVLVGAIAIGIVLIALTTVLNSAVFTENVAGGNSVEVTGDVTEFDREAVRNVRSIVLRINHATVYPNKTAPRKQLREHVEWNVSNHSRILGETYADTGSVYVGVDYDDTTKMGGRIVQRNDSTFTDPGGNADWQPIDGDHDIGWFVVNLEVENVSRTTPLYLNVTNTTGATLTVRMNGSSGNRITVNSSLDGAHQDECTYEQRNGRVLIDVVDGTAYEWDGNNECEFNSTEFLGPPYEELNIENGGSVSGKYDLVVNNSKAMVGVPNTDTCDSVPDERPCQAVAAWSVEFSTRYQTGSVTYEKAHNVSVYGG